MSKRLTILLLLLLAAVLFLAHTTHSQVKLVATKIEMSGEVKLSWTKPLSANSTTKYDLYRAALPDTTAIVIKTTADTSFVDHVPLIVSPSLQTFAYKVVAKTGLISIGSNLAYVAVPGIPEIGSYRLEGKLDSGKVKLYWPEPPIQPVAYYLVYRNTGELLSYIKIDSTASRISETPIPVVSPGAKVPVSFIVRAKLSTGNFLQSTTLTLTVENKIVKDELRFISIPNPNAQKNVPYVYTAKAISNDGSAVIRYFLEQTVTPPDFALKADSVTGIVSGTPTAKGLFKVLLVARSNKGGISKQEFFVSVVGGNGIIQGKVSDTLNIGIPNAIIEIFKTENSTSISYAYAVRTDPNGNFRINRVDPGNYKLFANTPSSKYQSQWYDGKREVSQADVVSVIDSPFVSITNFKLRGGPSSAVKINVSGVVTDTSGIAINGADCRVTFVRAEFALNFGIGMGNNQEGFRKYFDFNQRGDYRLEGNSEYVFKTKTDSMGKYKIALPPGGYIAFARAKGYAVEFYREQSNFISSEIIRIPDPRVPPMEPLFNFTLSPLPPVVLGDIKGTVLDTIKDIFVSSRVIAFRDGWRYQDNQNIGKVYMADTDSTGTFRFNELLPGTYVVMAIPLGNYAPSFYSADTLNNRWKRAAKIVVNGNSVDNINIYVKQFGPTANGYTAIYGNVATNGGTDVTKTGGIVYAYRNGEVAGYAFTNLEGNYIITGLSPGQYSVMADKTGFNESTSSTVNASYDQFGNPVIGLASFTINAVTNVTINTSVRPTNYELEQNYPNPFNPSTAISFSIPHSGNVSLKVFTVVGQEVATLINEPKEAGHYTVTFSANNFASGIYFYRLEAESFTVVKKMLLIK